MNPSTPTGKLFIVSAPSGTGKTTIIAEIQKENLAQISISHTTRPPRKGEVDGKDYFFVSREDFIAMRDDNLFLEWAEVYGNYYGTSNKWVQQQLKNNLNIILELDTQGAKQIKKLYPQATSIFISPPSVQALAERLKKRGKDSPEVIARRIAKAEAEMQYGNACDYVIINDNLQKAIAELRAILTN